MITHSVDDIANLLDVHARTVQQWVATGELKAVNVSRNRQSKKPRLRITQCDLDAFLTSRSVNSAKPKRTRKAMRKTIPQYV